MRRKTKRRQYPLSGFEYDDEEENDTKDYKQFYMNKNEKLIKQEVDINNLNKYIEEIKSNDNNGIISIGILLLSTNDQLIIDKINNKIINSNIIKLLLQFIDSSSQNKNNNNDLQYQSLSFLAISNKIILLPLIENHDIIQLLFKLLQTMKNNNQCIMAIINAINNISKQNESWKNKIISIGIYKYLLTNVESYFDKNDIELFQDTLSCISNLCGPCKLSKNACKELISWENIKICLPIFDNIWIKINDNLSLLRILFKCIKSTQIYLFNNNNNNNNKWINEYYIDLMESEIIIKLIEFCKTDYKEIIKLNGNIEILEYGLKLIVRLLQNCDKFDFKFKNKFIDYMINIGYLKLYKNLLSNLCGDMTDIRRIYCNGLSVICDGLIYNKYCILYYDNYKLLKLLTSKCVTDEDNIKMECGKCLSNIILCNNRQIIHLLCSKNVINALKYVMKTSSFKQPLIRCIESFDIILSKTIFPQNRDKYDYIYKIEKVGLVEVFDILQAGVDDSDKVFTFSYQLVNKYWEQTKPIITYQPLINNQKYYIKTKEMKNTKLVFQIYLIRDYLYKKQNVTFKINKKNCIIITCILQTITSQILINAAAKQNTMILGDDTMITLSSIRAVINESTKLFKQIFNNFDYKLTPKMAKNVYKHILDKVTDQSTNFMNFSTFNEVLNELDIDCNKYGEILYDLINDNEETINIKKWSEFCCDNTMDFDDKKINESNNFTVNDIKDIKNMFIEKIKIYESMNIETDSDIMMKINCIKNNINKYIKNKYSKFSHKKIENNNNTENIQNIQSRNIDNICNKLTEKNLFIKIFSHFQYEEILTNIYNINKLFHSVSIQLLDNLWINKIYSLDDGYLNSSIYETKKKCIVCGMRIDSMFILNAILLDLLDKIIDKIQEKYIVINNKNKDNNNSKNENQFDLMDNNIIHQILTELFESGKLITDILLQIDNTLKEYNNDTQHNNSNNNYSLFQHEIKEQDDEKTTIDDLTSSISEIQINANNQ